MMTGRYRSRDDLAEDDGRRWFPRYSEDVSIVAFSSITNHDTSLMSALSPFTTSSRISLNVSRLSTNSTRSPKLRALQSGKLLWLGCLRKETWYSPSQGESYAGRFHRARRERALTNNHVQNHQSQIDGRELCQRSCRNDFRGAGPAKDGDRSLGSRR
jgi:hypothetical protein